MMTDVKHYLDDGANWQAQAVLACLRGYATYCLHKDGDNEPSITVGRYENYRELFQELRQYRKEHPIYQK